MKKISVIGSGPAGCILAYGLVKTGFDVTLYSDKTPEQWMTSSKPTGSAYLYDEVIDIERALGMDHWSDKSFRGQGFLLDTLPEVGGKRTVVKGRTEYGRQGAAIDQRMRTSRWLSDFESIGGKLIIESVTPERLDKIAASSDLTALAAGKADLAAAIPRDAVRAAFDRPARYCAMAIVRSKSGKPVQDWFSPRLPYVPTKFNQFGDIGEYFWVPYEHKTAGATFSILLEARPGKNMDRFRDCKSGAEVTKVACDVVRETAPWEAHIADDMEYVHEDPNAWVTGQFTPTVRQGFGKLPSGGYVIPVGDTAITFDPICGQGGNFANRSAKFISDVIAARGEMPYDESWMTQINRDMWDNFGGVAYNFNNMFLEALDPTAQLVLETAAESEEAGDAMFNGFPRADRMWPVMTSPELAGKFAARFGR